MRQVMAKSRAPTLVLLCCAGPLLLQAQRAEVDCGSLLDELQQLIQAKADVAQQRADLDRCDSTQNRCVAVHKSTVRQYT